MASLILSLILPLLPLVLAGSGTEAPLDRPANDDIAYYYIDHSCTCAPTSELPLGKYWILTHEVYATHTGNFDPLLAQYNLFLESHFASPKAMSHDVVIRHQPTRSMAEASRSRKMEKMKRLGYTILESGFRPEPDRQP